MKKHSPIRILLWLFLLTTLAGCGNKLAKADIHDRIQNNEKQKIVWGVKVDTNLFGLYSIKDRQIQGFDIDIAKALTAEMTNGKGTAVFTEVTSKTRIPLLKNGNVDAIIATMTITPKRAEVVDFSEVYFDAGQSLLVPDGSHIKDAKSLTAKDTVIAIKGSTSADNIKKISPQAKIIELDSYNEGFTALVSGQGDALTTDNAILMGIMDKNPGYHLAGDKFTQEPYGIAVNKGQKAFQADINNALKTIKENGTYDQIYQKWFGKLNLKEGAPK